jgi:excisionase family DNA binding protein
MAKFSNRSPSLDKSERPIPPISRLWHAFARRLLTVREVAAYLRVSTRTVYALCEQGKLRHMRIANALRIEPGRVPEFERQTSLDSPVQVICRLVVGLPIGVCAHHPAGRAARAHRCTFDRAVGPMREADGNLIRGICDEEPGAEEAAGEEKEVHRLVLPFNHEKSYSVQAIRPADFALPALILGWQAAAAALFHSGPSRKLHISQILDLSYLRQLQSTSYRIYDLV